MATILGPALLEVGASIDAAIQVRQLDALACGA
jgi:hypothetical protein